MSVRAGFELMDPTATPVVATQERPEREIPAAGSVLVALGEGKAAHRLPFHSAAN
jgi:hypothetical protein